MACGAVGERNYFVGCFLLVFVEPTGGQVDNIGSVHSQSPNIGRVPILGFNYKLMVTGTGLDFVSSSIARRKAAPGFLGIRA